MLEGPLSSSSSRAMPLIALLLLCFVLYSAVDARSHPQRLTQVAPGVMAGALRLYTSSSNGTINRRSMVEGYQGQTMRGIMMGEYVIKVMINGQEVDAIVDTGSGINHVACAGATVPTGIKLIDPNHSPQLTLIPRSSATCNTIQKMVNVCCDMIDPPVAQEKPSLAYHCVSTRTVMTEFILKT